MHLALDPDAHSGSSAVRILVAGHSWPSGSCSLPPAHCTQEATGQDGAAPALRCLLFAENQVCKQQRGITPESRDHGTGTAVQGLTRSGAALSCTLNHGRQAGTWGLSPPREGGVLLTRFTTHAESLCHGHRAQGAEGGG